MTDVKAAYESLNKNERYGLRFALFPVRLKGLTHEEVVELMKLSEAEFGEL